MKPGFNDNEGIVNIAPAVRVWCAAVPDLNEAVILTPTVINLLTETVKYNVLAVGKAEPEPSNHPEDKADPHQRVAAINETRELDEDSLDTDAPNFLNTEEPEGSRDERVADRDTLEKEQRDCPALIPFWRLANQNRGNFLVENKLLYHRDTIMGHKVKQLCLPEPRVNIVLEMAHDAPFAGHMAFKTTRCRIKLGFWFPKMDDRIRTYCASCPICQLRAPVKVAHRVPITPIPRDDELAFTHLSMDCIGPIIAPNDPLVPKPEYNYALVLVDKFSRWPMAYPLRSLNAKGICDALLQTFMTFSVPKVITSDCGSNFTSKLTKDFLKRLGCTPRFNTPGHPEAAGLVERCNQSLKAM